LIFDQKQEPSQAETALLCKNTGFLVDVIEFLTYMYYYNTILCICQAFIKLIYNKNLFALRPPHARLQRGGDPESRRLQNNAGAGFTDDVCYHVLRFIHGHNKNDLARRVVIAHADQRWIVILCKRLFYLAVTETIFFNGNVVR
jgi:hypothetical protein